MSESLRRYWETCMRKEEPEDPRERSELELAGLLHGSKRTIAKIEEHLEERPELWDLADPRDLMRELQRLPGVGKAGAAWYVLNELQIGSRLRAAIAIRDEGEFAELAGRIAEREERIRELEEERGRLEGSLVDEFGLSIADLLEDEDLDLDPNAGEPATLERFRELSREALEEVDA